MVSSCSILPFCEFNKILTLDVGLAYAEYAVGYFTEMGIGTRRDPLEANVWYVRAAEHGDDRARQRLATIAAITSGKEDKKKSKVKRNAQSSPTKQNTDGFESDDDKSCVVM
jgi:TPR repeat protein